MQAANISADSTTPASEGLTALPTPVPCVQSGGRQKSEQGSVGQCRDPPKQSELNPRGEPVSFFQVEGQPENQRKQQRRQTCLPHPARAPVHYGGHHGPQPGRPHRQPFAETSSGDQKNGDASEGRKYAVDAQQHDCRGVRINPEQLEDSGNKKWIEWRFPCRRPRGGAERIAETLALRERAPDATHFPAKAEVVVKGLELVGVGDNNPAETQDECDQHHPEERCAGLTPPADEGTGLVRVCRGSGCGGVSHGSPGRFRTLPFVADTAQAGNSGTVLPHERGRSRPHFTLPLKYWSGSHILYRDALCAAQRSRTLTWAGCRTSSKRIS